MKVVNSTSVNMQYYKSDNSYALKEVSRDELPESVRMKLTPEGLRQAAKAAMERQVNNPERLKRIEQFKDELQPASVVHKIYLTAGITQKLNAGLKGQSDDVYRSVYSIIEDDLIPKDIGDMTENERKEKIYIGLEKAKYASEHLDKDKRGMFMEAVTRIAQMGLNGTNDGNGKMQYDSRPTVWFDTPEYMSTSEMLKLIEPERYNQLEILYSEGMQEQNEEKMNSSRKMMSDWELNMSSKNREKLKEIQEDRKQWAQKLKNTPIESAFESIDYSDIGSFKQNIIEQLRYSSKDEISESIVRFLMAFE